MQRVLSGQPLARCSGVMHDLEHITQGQEAHLGPAVAVCSDGRAERRRLLRGEGAAERVRVLQVAEAVLAGLRRDPPADGMRHMLHTRTRPRLQSRTCHHALRRVSTDAHATACGVHRDTVVLRRPCQACMSQSSRGHMAAAPAHAVRCAAVPCQVRCPVHLPCLQQLAKTAAAGPSDAGPRIMHTSVDARPCAARIQHRPAPATTPGGACSTCLSGRSQP